MSENHTHSFDSDNAPEYASTTEETFVCGESDYDITGTVHDLIKIGRQSAKDCGMFEYEGHFYSKVIGGDGAVTFKEVHGPRDDAPSSLTIATLSGLVQFIKTGLSGMAAKYENFTVVVENFRTVKVYSHPQEGRQMERVQVAECAHQPIDIELNEYRDMENFVIMMQTCFEQEANALLLQAVSGNLALTETIGTNDTGITQKLSLRKEIKVGQMEDFHDNLSVENPVTLRALRTFSEVEQPATPFTFRVREGRGGAPECGLFEADGGSFKVQAVRNIGAWLSEKLADVPGVVVIA